MTPAPVQWQQRLRSLLLFLMFALVFFFLFVTFGWTATLVVNSIAGEALGREATLILVSVLAGLPASVLATALMLMKFHDASFAFVGVDLQPGWFRELGAGFVLGLIMIFGVVLMEYMGGYLWLRWTGVSPLRALAQLWIYLLLLAVSAMHEELLFRGYAFQRLMEAIGAAGAAVLLSALFGAVHLSNPNASNIGAINTFIIGIAFALAYLRTRRLWFPIGLHWGWNYFQFAFGLPVSGIKIEKTPLSAEVAGNVWFHGGDYGPESSLIGTLVFVLAVVALWRWEGVPPPLPPGETDTGPSSEAL